MHWDCFCPNSCTMFGGMTEDDEEIENGFRKIDEICGGKIIYCSSCETYFEYNTHKILNFNDIKDKSKIIKVEDVHY